MWIKAHVEISRHVAETYNVTARDVYIRMSHGARTVSNFRVPFREDFRRS